ncbi:MAG: hypothetical protein WCA89_14715 [Terracidiphilus sp.]
MKTQSRMFLILLLLRICCVSVLFAVIYGVAHHSTRAHDDVMLLVTAAFAGLFWALGDSCLQEMIKGDDSGRK